MNTKTLQTNFQRIETKYIVPKAMLDRLNKMLDLHTVPDDYAYSTISNIYYDTHDYKMIRHALTDPTYKEKIRLRTYDALPHENSRAFVELKCKENGIGTKARVTTTLAEASAYLAGEAELEAAERNLDTIELFRERYDALEPKMFIYYDRYSLKGREDDKVRITFDYNLTFRPNYLDITEGNDGAPLLPSGDVVMEIKVPGVMPKWLKTILTTLDLQPYSFSKYGVAYRLMNGETVTHMPKISVSESA